MAKQIRNVRGKHVRISHENLARVVKIVADEAAAFQWRPIETAPKDGTWVVLFTWGELEEDEPRAHWGICFWYQHMMRWEHWGFHIKPTHWAPMSILDGLSLPNHTPANN